MRIMTSKENIKKIISIVENYDLDRNREFFIKMVEENATQYPELRDLKRVKEIFGSKEEIETLVYRLKEDSTIKLFHYPLADVVKRQKDSGEFVEAEYFVMGVKSKRFHCVRVRVTSDTGYEFDDDELNSPYSKKDLRLKDYLVQGVKFDEIFQFYQDLNYAEFYYANKHKFEDEVRFIKLLVETRKSDPKYRDFF